MRGEPLWTRVEAVFSSWREAKLFLEHSLAVSTESLHVVVGVLILLLAAWLLQRPVSSWRPWLVVLAFACFNEAVDLWIDVWPQPGMQFGESAKDLVLTMILPTVLLFTARKAPRLYLGGKAGSRSTDGT